MRTVANCFPVKINITISWWQVISEIDEPWMDKVTRFVRYGMAWRGKACTAHSTWALECNIEPEGGVVYPGKKNGEIRGEVNRSHKPDRVAVLCVFRDQAPPRRPASSFVGAGRSELGCLNLKTLVRVMNEIPVATFFTEIRT